MCFMLSKIFGIIYLRMAIISAVFLFFSSCRSGHTAQVAAGDIAPAKTMSAPRLPVAGGPSQYRPKAVIYQTNGDYADNVPVALDTDARGLLSYPAPTDITENSAPLKLVGGWWLDRCGGIGANTAFLKYTYTEYRNLKRVDAAMLMDAILPGAHVTEVRTLPVYASDAISHPEILNPYINNK